MAGVLPSLHISCVNASGLLVGDGGPKASVWPDCGVGIGRPEHARQVRTTVELMRYWMIFLASFQKISKAAIAKWRDDMKNRGPAARWVKSRSIVGVDPQHHVNWADEEHFEQCLASVPLVPRAARLATAKELATRWNTGVDELDRDLPGVQLSRIVDASFQSVNLVLCRRFSCETFQDSKKLARGGLVTLIATLLLGRQALVLGMGTLCVHWTWIPRLNFVSSLIAWVLLISPSFCCRPGWLESPRMMGRLIDDRSLS